MRRRGFDATSIRRSCPRNSNDPDEETAVDRFGGVGSPVPSSLVGRSSRFHQAKRTAFSARHRHAYQSFLEFHA